MCDKVGKRSETSEQNTTAYLLVFKDLVKTLNIFDFWPLLGVELGSFSQGAGDCTGCRDSEKKLISRICVVWFDDTRDAGAFNLKKDKALCCQILRIFQNFGLIVGFPPLIISPHIYFFTHLTRAHDDRVKGLQVPRFSINVSSGKGYAEVPLGPCGWRSKR